MRVRDASYESTNTDIHKYASVLSISLSRSLSGSLSRSLSVLLALSLSLSLSLALALCLTVLDKDRRNSRGNRSLSSTVHLRATSCKNNFRRRLVLGFVLLDATKRAQLEGHLLVRLNNLGVWTTLSFEVAINPTKRSLMLPAYPRERGFTYTVTIAILLLHYYYILATICVLILLDGGLAEG